MRRFPPSPKKQGLIMLRELGLVWESETIITRTGWILLGIFILSFCVTCFSVVQLSKAPTESRPYTYEHLQSHIGHLEDYIQENGLPTPAMRNE